MPAEIEALERVLSVAANEAVSAGYGEITTAHVLIALSRFSESDPSEQADTIKLRNEFDQLGVEPRRFRRRLRALLGRQAPVRPDGALHRSAHCKAVCSLAKAIAAREGTQPAPEHLLHAVFVSLAEGVDLGKDQPETVCSMCGVRMRPCLSAGALQCSACGARIDGVGEADASLPDQIPDEL